MLVSHGCFHGLSTCGAVLIKRALRRPPGQYSDSCLDALFRKAPGPHGGVLILLKDGQTRKLISQTR